MHQWKVYRNSVYIGIIETNYTWAAEYWQKRAIHTGDRFTLRKHV